MADHLESVYENHVKPLSAADRSRMLEMTACDLARTAPRDAEKRSILELRGKEIWHGVDAQQYVDGLRKKWRGICRMNRR